MDALSSLAITNRSLVIGFYPRLPYSSCLDTNGPALHFHALHSPSLRQSLNSSSCVRLFGSYGKSQKSAHRFHTPSYPFTCSIACLGTKKRSESKLSLFFPVRLVPNSAGSGLSRRRLTSNATTHWAGQGTARKFRTTVII